MRRCRTFWVVREADHDRLAVCVDLVPRSPDVDFPVGLLPAAFEPVYDRLGRTWWRRPVWATHLEKNFIASCARFYGGEVDRGVVG